MSRPVSNLSDCRSALAGAPGDCRLQSNLANALWVQDEIADALSWARWATRHRGASPWHPLVERCLGNILLDHGLFADADAAYKRSDPEAASPATQFNRSKTALGLGDFEEAWRLAEHRLSMVHPPEGALPGPWWQGWPEVNHVTVWFEQGLGDTLQFVRWLPTLLQRVPQVELRVQPPLERLLAQGLGWMGKGLSVVSGVSSAPDRCHGSLLSLPWLLREPSPPWPRPCSYLALKGGDGFSSRQRRTPVRVGVMWGAGRYLDGHTREREYRRKSLSGGALEALLQALRRRPLQLFKLQVGPDGECPEQAGIAWDGVLDPQADFLDLAELMLSLDLVLTVDTAAAHLAGALGRPTWLLLPWAAASRWSRGRTSTPWYPSLRLWRQPRHRDWLGLWPGLLSALDEWLVR